MNKKQQHIIIIGIVVLLLMGVFPPWIETMHTDKLISEHPKGYFPIYEPPSSSFYSGYKIDITRLLIQCIIVIGITFLIYYQAGKPSLRREDHKLYECSNCKGDVNQDDKYCSHCGEKL